MERGEEGRNSNRESTVSWTAYFLASKCAKLALSSLEIKLRVVVYLSGKRLLPVNPFRG